MAYEANTGHVTGVQRDFELIGSFINQVAPALFGQTNTLERELNSFRMRGYEDATAIVRMVLVGSP